MVVNRRAKSRVNQTAPPNDKLHLNLAEAPGVKSTAAVFALAIAVLCLAGCSAPGSGAAAGSLVDAGFRASVVQREVKIGVVPGLGKILVDGRDYALYAYVPDHQGRSKCYGECAFEWPPLVLPRWTKRPVGGPGLRTTLLGTTRRAGGALQVTYGGWPLYLYRNDGAPGEATGQGDDMGLWYVVSPSGAIDRQPLN